MCKKGNPILIVQDCENFKAYELRDHGGEDLVFIREKDEQAIYSSCKVVDITPKQGPTFLFISAFIEMRNPSKIYIESEDPSGLIDYYYNCFSPSDEEENLKKPSSLWIASTNIDMSSDNPSLKDAFKGISSSHSFLRASKAN